MHFTVAFIAAFAVLAFAQNPTPAQKPTPSSTCNNYAELCNQPYSNVTFLTTHNAYAVGSSIAANQHISISEQLDRGVRAIMLDIWHKDPKKPTFTPRLCHNECGFLDAGTLQDTLSTIKTWLSTNPNNILTLIIENGGKFTASALAAAFAQAGVDDQCFVFRGERGTWPTLQQMLTANQRIVVFVDNLIADGDGSAAAPYLLSEYSLAWETPFKVEYKNPVFTCAVDRPKSGIPQVRNPLYVLNHFVYGQLPLTGASGVSTSYPQAANEINGASLQSHVDQCTGEHGKPNFVALDYFEVGDAQKVVSALNQVAPPPELPKKEDLVKKKSDAPKHTVSMMSLFVGLAMAAFL